ncbi:YNFM family putative membrane transporter [Rhizobium sp. BK529]|uniref:MFS transporter n=1 Tax=unclassified Rhizobium TaxID=2613769 RepID=UPI0010E2CFB4|nr:MULTISPECIES: MFS transporter [unclassified Rhizobium]MBB3592799.1 YNFM family putative membrane transporter [Rhizobium sp. BK529]TCS07181.1 YNFM family putative membrane transporter [Rhizobium sp. BK418]
MSDTAIQDVADLQTGDRKQTRDYLTRGTGAYRRASLALFLSGFATFSLLYCVQPLLPIFSQEFAVSPAESSLVLSLATGFLAIAIVFAAAVSEGLGRRGLMSISLVGAALLTIATAFAPNWHLMLVIRALQGFVLGGVPAVAMAYLAEEIDPRGLGATMGLYVGGTAFGGMSGRVLTGIFAEYLSWRPALFLIGAIGLAAAIGFIALLPPSRNFVRRAGFDPQFHLKAWLGHLSNPALPLIFASAFFAMGSFVTIYNYAGFRLVAPPYGLNQTELGLIFTVYLFGIGASSVGGILGDRFGQFAVLMAGILITAAGCALTLSASLPLIILGIIVLTSGFFMTHSVGSGLVGKLAAGTKGHASSLYMLAYYIGSSIMGSAGGWFWAMEGWASVVIFTLILMALAFFSALTARRLARRPT